jgi:ATP-binding cassette subfamily B (MDR/TAP) protein 1
MEAFFYDGHTSAQQPNRSSSPSSPLQDRESTQKENGDGGGIGGRPDETRDILPHATEAEILIRQVHTPTSKIGYFSLYRYATTKDWLIIAISSLCAISSGAALPMMTILFGQISGLYQAYFTGSLIRGEFNARLTHFVLFYVYLAIAEFMTIYISMVGFTYTGERITVKIRQHYLTACLR